MTSFINIYMKAMNTDQPNNTSKTFPHALLVWLSGAILLSNISIAQDGKTNAEKSPFSMTVSSISSNGVRTVKAHLIKKENKKKMPVDDVKAPFHLYYSEVKDYDAASGTGLIAKSNVNIDGDVIFPLPAGFNKQTDTVHKLNFIVKMSGDPKYE